MKRYIILMLLSLFGLTGLTHAISYDTCSGRDDFDGYYSQDVNSSDVSNYTLEVGFGTDESFTPNEISILYSDDSCTNVVMYESHNGDSAQLDADLLEQNFMFSENLFSSYYIEITTRNQGISTAGWEFHGSVFITTSSYTITVDDSATTGDPFNGDTQNLETYIIATIDIGSSTDLCTFHNYNDGTNDLASFTAVDGGACTLTITTSDGSSYISYMNVSDQAVTVDSLTNTFSPTLNADLYYDDDGTLLETDATVEFDGMSFYFSY